VSRPAPAALDLRALPGCRWLPNGQSSLSGPLLDLYRRVDRMFAGWAAEWGAAEHRFPPFLPARELAGVDYLRSFPHLATFPVALDPADENLLAFTRGDVPDALGRVPLTATTPVLDVLTPAACYHFYAAFRGEQLAAPRYVTTCATCFRREAHYAPLARQWSFSMREIVCLGTPEEVRSFLDHGRCRAARAVEAIGLEVAWEAATDPFFRPRESPKHLAQRLDPLKTEMIADGLAIGSVNFHRSYFGEAFGIGRDGGDASSGCLAFGVERWLHAILTRFGPEPAAWPSLERA
jgi:hypothetical protein